MIYLKQMYTRLLNYVGNHCWKYYNGLILLEWFLDESPFYHFHFKLFELPSIFIVLGVKSSK